MPAGAGVSSLYCDVVYTAPDRDELTESGRPSASCKVPVARTVPSSKK
jgi:hypothetical protein